MPFNFPGRPLLALPLMAPLFGCADKPAGTPIVLRPHHPERQAAHRATPRSRGSVRTAAQAQHTPSTQAPAQTEDLSPEEKESVLREFDDFLRNSDHH